MFEVTADCAANRLYVTLTGFASADHVERFGRDLATALLALPRERGSHQLLYDVSSAKIQSQEIVAAMRELVRATPKVSAFALVNASALAGRQLRRIFAGLDPMIFQRRDDAIAWLDELIQHDEMAASND